MAWSPTPSALVRLDDLELNRWIRELPDEELSTGLRALVARASHLLVVLELISFDEVSLLAEGGASLTEVFREVRRLVQPVRAASDELSQAFITIGHIDVDSETQPDGIEPGRYDAPDPRAPVIARERVAAALSSSRRLIAREWRTLKHRLEDESVRSSPSVLVTFCRAHLDRVQTLVESIAPALFAVLAPAGLDVEGAEVEASRAVRTSVVDFHRTCRDVSRTLETEPAADWPPHLQRAVEALDVLLFSIAFTWMRDGDQRMLTDCRELLDQTLALWNPLRAAPMKRVMQTLSDVADSLLRINDRPSLVRHDTRELGRVLERVATTARMRDDDRSGRELRASVLVTLSRVYGRDLRLDQLAADGLEVGGTIDLEAIRERCCEVLEMLDDAGV